MTITVITSRLQDLIVAKKSPVSATNAIRTAVAALVSLLVAHLFGLAEYYWAGITTLAVMQSTLEASLPVSVQQLAGNAVGALIGGWAGAYFSGNALVCGVCVLAIGILFASFQVERTAYRYATTTLAIVMLVPSHSGWTVAVHRFLEVSIGIAVSLAVSVLWPEPAEE